MHNGPQTDNTQHMHNGPQSVRQHTTHAHAQGRQVRQHMHNGTQSVRQQAKQIAMRTLRKWLETVPKEEKENATQPILLLNRHGKN